MYDHKMNSFIEEIRITLQGLANQKTLETSSRFFKEGEAAKVYGVRMPFVNQLAKDTLKMLNGMEKEAIFDLCEELWKSSYLEEAIIACTWSASLHKLYEEKDLKRFEYWIETYVTNWADCDTFCNHTIGQYMMNFPNQLEVLKRWALSEKRFVRRASAVSLIVPAKKGYFLNAIFEIADILLLDVDDLVQKGYGWMLKAASQSNPEAVFDYVMLKKSIMPRTALRYAIEKLPAEWKVEAMKR